MLATFVLYMLTEDDAKAVNKRRSDAKNLNAAGVTIASQGLGPVIHTGNKVEAGDEYPMLVVRVWGPPPGGSVNGQVFLDGNDTLWVTSVAEGDGPRKFRRIT